MSKEMFQFNRTWRKFKTKVVAPVFNTMYKNSVAIKLVGNPQKAALYTTSQLQHSNNLQLKALRFL